MPLIDSQIILYAEKILKLYIDALQVQLCWLVAYAIGATLQKRRK